MLEQLGGRGPLVRLELPRLAGGEDGDEAAPVIRAEVGGAVDEDEAGGFSGGAESARCGAGWVGEGAQRARDVEDVGVGHGEGGVVGGHEDAVLEEGPHVGHADEG